MQRNGLKAFDEEKRERQRELDIERELCLRHAQSQYILWNTMGDRRMRRIMDMKHDIKFAFVCVYMYRRGGESSSLFVIFRNFEDYRNNE